MAAKRRCNHGVPDEILEEILLRLPVRSLLRFRTVCKSWCATIADPRFVRCHAELSSMARRTSLLVLPRGKLQPWQRMGGVEMFSYPGHGAVAELVYENFWTTDVVPWTRPLHCDGLVVILTTRSQIFVCNPATREFVELPSGSPDCCIFEKVGFAADPSTRERKLVRCFYRHREGTAYSVGCEVFTLGSRAWRPVADPPYAVLSRAPVCLPGAVYWAGLAFAASTMEGRIVRFSLSDEAFTVSPIPPCSKVVQPHDCMTELAGKLCYAHAPGSAVELWMAEDGVQLEWSLRYTINFLQPKYCSYVAPFAAYDGSIFFNVGGSQVYRYDIRGGAVERVVDMQRELVFFYPQLRWHLRVGAPIWIHHIIEYSESLVSIRGC